MKVYIIQTKHGDYCEDWHKEIYWVGHNEESALLMVDEYSVDAEAREHEARVYFSIWEAGKCLTEYMRHSWFNDGSLSRGKWERNRGTVYPNLEREEKSENRD